MTVNDKGVHVLVTYLYKCVDTYLYKSKVRRQIVKWQDLNAKDNMRKQMPSSAS